MQDIPRHYRIIPWVYNPHTALCLTAQGCIFMAKKNYLNLEHSVEKNIILRYNKLEIVFIYLIEAMI